MPHVISPMKTLPNGTILPAVVDDLGFSAGVLVSFGTNFGGEFILPPDYHGVVPNGYVIVSLEDESHTEAVALGYEPVEEVQE